MSSQLEVRGLQVTLPVGGQQRTVIHDATFTIGAGEAVGLIGESGSGKSMTAKAILHLLPTGARTSGEILFEGQQVLPMTGRELQRYRSGGVAMIFQDPRAYINPVRTIGDFLTEALHSNLGMKRKLAERRAIALLAEVGIEDGERRLRQYPHQLSGGLLQRIMIAAALISEPRLLLADEPTTALDVTTQSEVVAILDRLRRERGLSLLFITHDIELASAICDRTCVMYAGSIVEDQTAHRLHEDPLHPYTAALLGSRPSVTSTARRLPVVPGRVLSAIEAPEGCAFADRCPHARSECRTTPAELVPFEGGHVRCGLAGELRDSGVILAKEGGLR